MVPAIIVSAENTEWLFIHPENPIDSAVVFLDYKNKKLQKNYGCTIQFASDSFEHLKKLSKRIVQILNSKTEHQFDTMLSYHYFPETDVRITTSMKIECLTTTITESTVNLLRNEFSSYKNICMDSQQMMELANYLFKRYREEHEVRKAQRKQQQYDIRKKQKRN